MKRCIKRLLASALLMHSGFSKESKHQFRSCLQRLALSLAWPERFEEVALKTE